MKLHEWIALIGGVLGTLLSILNLVLNYRRDRAHLHFSPYDDYDLPYPKTTIFLAVANIGRRPIRVTDPWIYWRDGDHWPMNSTQPITLMEQDRTTYSLTKDRRIEEVLAFSIRDSGDREYWHYPRFRPFARIGLMWSRWRQRNSELA